MKAVLAVVFGGIAYSVTELTGQEEVWQLTITIFIGGATLIVQYMVDFERRLGEVGLAVEQHADGMTTSWGHHTAGMEILVETGFARVSEATKFFGEVSGSALPTEALTDLVRSATAIGGDEPDIIYAFAEAELRRVTQLLRDLKTDHVDYAGEDHDWLLTLTDVTRATIDATSTSVDYEFWTTELGRRYLVAQRKAILRGVRVRRLFIVADDAEAQDASVQERCRRHAELGVEVRVATTSTFPETARIDTMIDFIVFDGEATYEVRPELSAQPVIDTTRMVWRSERVAQCIHRFNDLWAVGRPPAEFLQVGP
ncbi:DUF6879 family protein [Yinghuangia soli]|uniref:DUF6879 domain-containing protein n=1 Tax=Yinghuangia soli TaxID=2908204 RepID=A0AA41U3W9_9ACTN|nr:DUF6879 family protein [Yinghuangia soli]MCF2528479.1 hypothetical protein [Yinghuangia soli]